MTIYPDRLTRVSLAGSRFHKATTVGARIAARLEADSRAPYAMPAVRSTSLGERSADGVIERSAHLLLK